jgi:type I restriction enzyme S subunit
MEQRAIACILGSLDDKIELNRRINRTLEEMARAIFKSWFIDFDPVRAKAAVRREHPKWTDEQVSRTACPNLKPEIARLFPDSFEYSELGEIPKGWRIRALDEIACFLNGLPLQKFPPEGGDSLPVIKIAHLRSGNTAGAERASARLHPDYIVKDGDILFSWSGSLECILWAGGPGALNQHLFKVTSSEYPRWLCYFAVHQHLDEFRHIAASKATTMGHIQRHDLASAKVVVPADGNLLSAVDAVLSPMFESLWQRQVLSRTLAALRDALLPKLLSGELRVADAERIAARYA